MGFKNLCKRNIKVYNVREFLLPVVWRIKMPYKCGLPWI